MDINFIELFLSWVPTFITIAVVVGVYVITKKLLTRKSSTHSDFVLIRTISLFVISIIGFLFIILAAPIPTEIKGQITSLFGIIISAAIALSSATFLGNALAGIMLKFINSYKIGDFIRSGDTFGRVTERGIFHTEIQTENRDLVTIPNLQLANKEVHVTRASGTFISASCSLGYDVNQSLIKTALVKATEMAELEEGFVHITELGDFSVVYKVFGLLKDAKTIVSARSRLYSSMLTALHEADIEIVSPSFMNQRQVGDTVFIPKKIKTKEIEETNVEALLFDKATEAESLHKSKETVSSISETIQELQSKLKEASTDEEKLTLENKIKRYQKLKTSLENVVITKQENLNDKS